MGVGMQKGNICCGNMAVRLHCLAHGRSSFTGQSHMADIRKRCLTVISIYPMWPSPFFILTSMINPVHVI